MRISDWSSDVCSSDLPLRMGHYKLGKLADDFIERSRADGQVFRERLPLPDLRSVGGELSAPGIRQLRRDRCHSAGKCCRDGTREPIILQTKSKNGRASGRERGFQYV